MKYGLGKSSTMFEPTDAQLAEKLRGEGEMWDLLEQFKQAGYVAVAFNCWSKHLPQSKSWRNYDAPRELRGHTFARPGPAYDETIVWPAMWGILRKFYGCGSCGNGHHYQLAPDCGMRVFVLEHDEWVEQHDEE